MALGVIFSIIVSVLFAVYAVPRKFSSMNAALYTFWTGAAYFAGACLVCAAVWGFGLGEPEDMTSSWHWLSLLRGVIWALGTVAFNMAIDRIGLARFNQWKNLQGPIGSILMLCFVTDVAGEKIVWVALGTVAMFVSAMLFTIKSDGGGQKSALGGILLALFAAVCFGATAFINRLITAQGFIYSQLFFHSLAVTVTALAAFLITKRTPKEIFRPDKTVLLPMMTGVMFLAATVLTIFSYMQIPGSVAWSITQLCAMWTMLIGIFVFKEVRFRAHRTRIIAGFAFAFAAIGLLFFAM